MPSSVVVVRRWLVSLFATYANSTDELLVNDIDTPEVGAAAGEGL
jgi:hypothetical protein